MSKKIVILKRRQLLLSAVLIVIAIAVVLIVSCFTKSNNTDTPSLENARYIPGLYSSDIQLSEYTLHLELAVDRDCIKSVNITNLDEEILSMYPLIEPSLQTVSEQLLGGIAIDAVTISEDSKFTQMLLIEAIGSMLEKATLPTEDSLLTDSDF